MSKLQFIAETFLSVPSDTKFSGSSAFFQRLGSGRECGILLAAQLFFFVLLFPLMRKQQEQGKTDTRCRNWLLHIFGQTFWELGKWGSVLGKIKGNGVSC